MKEKEDGRKEKEEEGRRRKEKEGEGRRRKKEGEIIVNHVKY